MTSRNIEKYLNRYAEPEASHDLNLGEYRFDAVIVIPCFKETIHDVLATTAKIEETILTILINNSPESHEPITLQLEDDLCSVCTLLSQTPGASLLKYSEQQTYLLIDRCRTPIAPRLGVGLARKIGCDIALKLIHQGAVKHPFIFNTDADAVLPKEYIKQLGTYQQVGKTDISAFIYGFQHGATPEFQQLSLLYEIHMLHYAAMLRWAGSQFGFTTIGSTIAISAEHYAMVRGFPKRSAGEDFYLLNKLAKVGRVTPQSVVNETGLIELQARASERVPFGTGPALLEMQAQHNPLQSYLYYKPRIFFILQQLLRALLECQAETDADAFLKHEMALRCNFSSNEQSSFEDYLIQSGLAVLVESKQSQKSAVFEKALFDWLDGFRTLKFIHHFRNNGLNSIPLGELLKQSPILKASEHTLALSNIELSLDQLDELRRILLNLVFN